MLKNSSSRGAVVADGTHSPPDVGPSAPSGWRRLASRIFSGRAQALRDAQARWRSARSDYLAAKDRGDTRAMNAAHKDVRAWATVAMRLELGR